MSSADHGLNIAELPSDVIRHILRVGQESLQGMRLLSPRWNCLALEYHSDRKRLPIISSLNWCTESYGDEYYSFYMEVADEYADFFGVPNQLKLEWMCDSTTCGFGVMRKFGKVKKQEWFSKRVTRLIDRCSSIKHLELEFADLDKKRVEFNRIRSVMGNVDIQELYFGELPMLTQQAVSNMVNIISVLSVRCLVVQTGCFPVARSKDYENIVRLLRRAVSLVHSIDLISVDFTENGWDEATLIDFWKKYSENLSRNAYTTTCKIEKDTVKIGDGDSFFITVTARKRAISQE